MPSVRGIETEGNEDYIQTTDNLVTEVCPRLEGLKPNQSYQLIC